MPKKDFRDIPVPKDPRGNEYNFKECIKRDSEGNIINIDWNKGIGRSNCFEDRKNSFYIYLVRIGVFSLEGGYIITKDDSTYNFFVDSFPLPCRCYFSKKEFVQSFIDSRPKRIRSFFEIFKKISNK
jgi:hypothetical protein